MASISSTSLPVSSALNVTAVMFPGATNEVKTLIFKAYGSSIEEMQGEKYTTVC